MKIDYHIKSSIVQQANDGTSKTVKIAQLNLDILERILEDNSVMKSALQDIACEEDGETTLKHCISTAMFALECVK